MLAKWSSLGVAVTMAVFALGGNRNGAAAVVMAEEMVLSMLAFDFLLAAGEPN